MDSLVMILIAAVLVLVGLNTALLFRQRGLQQRCRDLLENGDNQLNRLEQQLRDEMFRSRQETALTGQQGREELQTGLRSFETGIAQRMTEIATLQKHQLEAFAGQLNELTRSNERRMQDMRQTMETSLRSLQTDNAVRLEEMRRTVDEKLQNTLEQRLGESFRLVSERLELVHRGLGEMQHLASGVGDLKKVLSNVKTRGIWGEVQLGTILEQILTPDQYQSNVAVRPGSGERVEFAVCLPGRNGEGGPVWLPIDAKFPQEDFHRLLDATEQGDQLLAEQAARELENRIRLEAKTIAAKYIDPPHTTDFALMFLPTESLYAEVLRRPGLVEVLQREFRVTVTGPTTLAAVLNSLALGFRTLAIEKRSSEVWSLLGAVKTEFTKFGTVLEKTQKKLQEASNSIEFASRRSRVIAGKLRSVAELPSEESAALLDGEGGSDWERANEENGS